MLLSGKWDCKGYGPNGEELCFSGTVPGCVHTDLIKSKLISDIFYRDNADSAQWIENWDFTFTRTFSVDKIEENAFIVFEGLDTYCDIYVNDMKIGPADNMFIPHEFRVDNAIRCGENTIEVRFFSPIKKTKDLPPRPAAFSWQRVYTRRIQCTYGWDWVGRFVTMGIFRDVRLEFRKANRISSSYIYTKNINPYSAQMSLEVNIDDIIVDQDDLLITILDTNGQQIFSKKRRILESTIYETIDIVAPQLWYPNGYGKQPLYTLILESINSTHQVTFGIREVVVLQIEDAPNSQHHRTCCEIKESQHLKQWDHNDSFSGFILLVNGIKIMCKGANWVPCDPFPSAETPQKIEHLVSLGADAGVNMLRVWGGGIFEQQAFYDACDKMGILVTQDFLMACGSYPEEDDCFIEQLKKETKVAAIALRNHPCLVWWSGDNENAVNGNENILIYSGRRAASEGIAPVLRQFDPYRLFFPSSPYGGKPFASATKGTTHNTQFLSEFFAYILNSDYTDYREHFSLYLARFTAEQPILGMPFISSLQKFMTDEDIFGDDTDILEYHTKNNPGLGALSIFNYIDIMTRKLFGEYKDGADRIAKMQQLQCEWVRLSMELFRRHKWFSSGIIYWMFNDCWPAANSWSIIDYYGMVKPAYYAFKRCAKPVIASIDEKDGRFTVTVCNDSLKNVSGQGELYLLNTKSNERMWSRSFKFEVGENVSAGVLEFSRADISELDTKETILLCDICGEFGSDRAFFLSSPYRDKDFGRGTVKILERTTEYIKITANEYVQMVVIDVPYLLEDNCFPLLKNEVRKLKILPKRKF